ncbi:Ankyrin repeat protein [Aspergillus sp. HF37]|nr:Ankyrin repeat protein [Aspergillus sp. HF37]
MEAVDISSLVAKVPRRDSIGSAQYEELKAASAAGDVGRVRRLFDSTKPDSREGNYLLLLAQRNGHIRVTRHLVSHGIPIEANRVRDAIAASDYRSLSLFLDNGYDINQPKAWCTPSVLIHAFDNEDLCRWLLDRGADPNARCILDVSPLSIAVREAPLAIIKLLLQRGGSIECGQLLHYAVARDEPDYLEVLDFLLNKGLSAHINRVMFTNDRISYEWQKAFGIGTPLHHAADDGKLDLVDALISWGADPSVKDERGKLAIDRSRWNERMEVVERLRGLRLLKNSAHL